MIASDSAVSVFQIVSGIAAGKLSLLIRTFLIAILFLWAALCIYGMVEHFRHHDIEIDQAGTKVFRVIFIVTVMTVLVFVK